MAKSGEYEPRELDIDLLGLKYELVNHLSEAGFEQYSDYKEIEVDLGNHEIKVNLITPFKEMEQALRSWGQREKFKKVFFSQEKGAIYFRR